MKKTISAIILCSFIFAAFTGCIQDHLESQPSTTEKTIVSSYEEQSESTADESIVQSSTLTSVESGDSSDTNSKASKKSESSKSSDKTKNSSKSESKPVSEKSSTQSSGSVTKQPNISYEITDESSAPTEHSKISAEASGSSGSSKATDSGKKVYGVSIEIADNDPHKNEKIRIIENIKDILSREQYRYSSGGLFYLELQLEKALNNENINFEVNGKTNMLGLSSSFADGTPWEIKYSQVYTDEKLKMRAKRSSNDFENQQLDTVLSKVKGVLSGQPAGELTDETIFAVSDAVFDLMIENTEMMDVQVWYDGIGGQFADGTNWGYTFQELR